jgi:thiol-disulfide isomerase/thioredoxin
MPDAASPEPARAPRLRLAKMLLAAGAVLLIGAGAVLYGMGRTGKEAAGACAAAARTVARLDPLVHGEVAAMSLSRRPKALDGVSFQTGDGAPRTLADFRGRTVLLNLWATWCVPCRKEMPALDRLETAAGGADFQVVAVNVDNGGPDRAKEFLTKLGTTALPFYADGSGKLLPALYQQAAVTGLPTSFLIDPNGCVLGTMAGPADWASDEARRLIAAARS